MVVLHRKGSGEKEHLVQMSFSFSKTALSHAEHCLPRNIFYQRAKNMPAAFTHLLSTLCPHHMGTDLSSYRMTGSFLHRSRVESCCLSPGGCHSHFKSFSHPVLPVISCLSSNMLLLLQSDGRILNRRHKGDFDGL